MKTYFFGATTTTMVLFLVKHSARAFAPHRSIRSSTTSSTMISASFFDALAKSFSTTSSTNSQYYTVGITGSSGLVGTALIDELQRRTNINGKPVRIVSMIRGQEISDALPEDGDTEATRKRIVWNPNGSTADQVLSPSVVSEIDAIVHLSGENVATGTGPLGFLGIQAWSPEKKKEILESRVVTTKALADVLKTSSQPKTFLCASGIGIYGDKFFAGPNAEDPVDERAETASTKGFLADVSRAWEAATLPAASNKKNRVVNMRFGVVLSKNGGALAKLFPVFFLGGGGNVGSGDQYFTFISARDLARGIIHTLETPTLQGPVNMAAPFPCTNAEFTKALGQAMGRPTILPFPAFAVKLLFGEMGEEMLLGGVRAVPGKLQASGFYFKHPTILEAIQSALTENI